MTSVEDLKKHRVPILLVLISYTLIAILAVFEFKWWKTGLAVVMGTGLIVLGGWAYKHRTEFASVFWYQSLSESKKDD